MLQHDGRRTLTAASLALIMVMLNVSIVNTALPAIAADLGGGLLGQQWIANSYNLVFAALLLLGGLLGDRFGHRWMLRSGVLLSIAAALAATLAPSTGALIAARSVQGFASALVQPATLALITYAFSDPRERAKALGLWGAISGLGIALGPVLGGVLVDTLGWRAVFLAIVPVGIAALWAAFNGVQETPPQPRPVDYAGLVLITFALVSLSLGLSEGQRIGFATPIALGLLSSALLAFGLFIAIERRAPAALVDLAAFRHPPFAVANLNGLLAFFATFPILTYLGIHLQEVSGLSATQTGLLIVLFPVAFAGASISGARLLARWGPRVPTVLGMLLSATGALALAAQGLNANPYNVWWQITLLGVGVGVSMSSLTTTAVGSVSLGRSGMASSLLAAVRQVGSALGIAVLGVVVALNTDPEMGLRLAALLAGSVLLIAAGNALRWLPGQLVGATPVPVAQEANDGGVVR